MSLRLYWKARHFNCKIQSDSLWGDIWLATDDSPLKKMCALWSSQKKQFVHADLIYKCHNIHTHMFLMKTAGYFKHRHLWSSRNICVCIRNTLVLHLNRNRQIFLCALKNILVERAVYIKILKHTCAFLRVHLFILRPFWSRTRPWSSGENILCLTRSTIPVNFSTFLKLAARSSATSMTTSRPCCRGLTHLD